MKQTPRTISITLQADPALIRIETFEEKEFTVVPVVALTEGVLTAANADGPELVLASEFANPAAAWDGSPVTAGHPVSNGELVSAAASPKVFEEFTIGLLFASRLDDKKLKVEAWLDNEKIEKVGGAAQTALERINAGEEVEVSTGYFADSTPVNGVFNGEAYIAIQDNIKPNHLAILADGVKGACSWEDGCGAPRVNLQKEVTDVGVFKFLQKRYRNPTITDGTAETVIVDNVVVDNGEHSDRDKRFALSAALEEKGEFFFSVVAVFQDFFVYERNFNELVQRSYTINEDNSITLGDVTEQVRPVTEFIPVKVNEEKTVEEEKKEEKKEAVTNSEDGQEQTEEQKKEASLEAEKAKEVEKTALLAAQAAEEQKAPKSLERFIAEDVPPELRESIMDGRRLLEEKRSGLIQTLVSNDQCAFEEDELKTFPIDTLEKLNTLAARPDYSGQAGQMGGAQKEDPNAVPEPPEAFPRPN